jgi:hypothetical protein
MEALAKRKKSEKLHVQERDVRIFEYLNRVGYANLEQITKFILGSDNEKDQNAILRRLYLLRRFEYTQVMHTHVGNYYALTRRSKMENELIRGVKLDQLPHHNFLLELFYLVRHCDVLTEREVLARYKIVGQKGKIPDMVINGWVVEYERTNKSAADCSSLFKYWTADKNKKVCLIYETEEIRNRYERSIIDKSKVVLLDRHNYKNILNVLNLEEALPIKDVKEEIKVIDQEQMSSNVTQKEGIKTFGNFSFN